MDDGAKFAPRPKGTAENADFTPCHAVNGSRLVTCPDRPVFGAWSAQGAEQPGRHRIDMPFGAGLTFGRVEADFQKRRPEGAHRMMGERLDPGNEIIHRATGSRHLAGLDQHRGDLAEADPLPQTGQPLDRKSIENVCETVGQLPLPQGKSHARLSD